ncbi:MAG: hypothetical protein AAF604_12800 [Acidobacteriota bacterium]
MIKIQDGLDSAVRAVLALILAVLFPWMAFAGERSPAFGAPQEPAPEALAETLERAFSRLEPSQVPTGILLERGAVWGGAQVQAATLGERTDGAEKPLSRGQVEQAYFDLSRGALTAALLAPEEIASRARFWREEARAIPLSLAIIDYDTMAGDLPLGVHDGVLDLPAGRLGETRTFVAAQAVAEKVYGWSPRFVVPSDLLLLNGPTAGDVEEVWVRIGDTAERLVELDRPFRVAGLPDRSGSLEISVRAVLRDRTLTGRGLVPFHTVEGDPGKPLPPVPWVPPGVPPAAPVPCVAGEWFAENQDGKERVRFVDLTRSVVGAPFFAPWNEPFQASAGRVNVRVIPAHPGAVRQVSESTCEVQLRRPVVLIDGIDIFNERTQDTILELFGGTIKMMHDVGLDVITVDYQNGRDWMQRNGRAIRQLLTSELENLVHPEALTPGSVAVIAGSMGTQVARWAMMEAEGMGLEHHAGLFINLDGPYRGANIPIGFQYAAVDFKDFVADAEKFLGALESPAASQLMRRTYPRGASIQSPGWYMPRPENAAFYGAATAMGELPLSTRNVAGANGSGLGTPQSSLGQDVQLLLAQASLAAGLVVVVDGEVEVRSDGAGAVAYRRRICSEIYGLITFCDELNRPIPGLGFDTTPGSTRFTTLDFLEALNGADLPAGLDPTFEYELDRHAFIPTSSVIGPVPWDNFTWEKCNTPHVFPTPTMVSLVITELEGFFGGSVPPRAPLFRTGCDVPEPSENCFPGVLWFEDPEEPEFLRPWDNGAACYVTPVPAGEEGRVVAGQFTVAAEVECFDGADPLGPDCLFTEVQSPGVDQVTIPSIGILHIDIIDHAGPGACPVHTRFIEVIDGGPGPLPLDKVVCEILPRPGVSLADLSVVGRSVMAPADSHCAVGVVRTLDGEPACYLGTSPAGTRPFEHNGAFFYDGWD